MICDCVGLPGAPAPAYFPEFKSASPPPAPPPNLRGLLAGALGVWVSGTWPAEPPFQTPRLTYYFKNSEIDRTFYSVLQRRRHWVSSHCAQSARTFSRGTSSSSLI